MIGRNFFAEKSIIIFRERLCGKADGLHYTNSFQKKSMREIKFCECVSKCKSDLYMIARAILGNDADTEDAVSNAILRAYENLDKLKNPNKFKPWILTITKNEALKIKKKRLELPGNDTLEAFLEPVEDHHDELWDIIQSMKEEYRLAIVLYYYDGLSLRDISDVLNIPLGTVKSRLSRGKEILRNALKKGDEDERF